MIKNVAIALLCAGASLAFAESPSDVLRASMVGKNQATLDRIEQDDVQAFCSKPRAERGDLETMNAVRERAMAGVEYPADGAYLGDWVSGGEIANNGRGLQYSDNPADPNGGNCYACHQLDPRDGLRHTWAVTYKLRRPRSKRRCCSIYVDEALEYPCL